MAYKITYNKIMLIYYKTYVEKSTTGKECSKKYKLIFKRK